MTLAQEKNAIDQDISNKAGQPKAISPAILGSRLKSMVDTLTDFAVGKTDKAQPNGIATLDENGKVPSEQLPEISGELPHTSNLSLIAETIEEDGVQMIGLSDISVESEKPIYTGIIKVDGYGTFTINGNFPTENSTGFFVKQLETGDTSIHISTGAKQLNDIADFEGFKAVTINSEDEIVSVSKAKFEELINDIISRNIESHLAGIDGYNGTENQTLENNEGVFNWVTKI